MNEQYDQSPLPQWNKHLTATYSVIRCRMIQDFIMKTRSLLIVNCDNREYAPMNDLENPSRLLTYSPVLLVYFELPEPVNMAGDTVGTKVHMFRRV